MKLAYIFPGQGSQFRGMGRDIYEEFSIARDVFLEADESLGFKISEIIFNGSEEELKITSNTQPAILTVSVAIYRVLEGEFDIIPNVAAGHSLGEWSALVATGAIEFRRAVEMVWKRGVFMQEAVPEGVGSMAAILGFDAGRLEQICREVSMERMRRGCDDYVVVPANFNAYDQIVIAGHTAAVEEAMRMAKVEGAKKAIPLAVSGPFHSPLMKPAAERLDRLFNNVELNGFRFPVISNVTADIYPGSASIRELLTMQVYTPVRWVDCVKRLMTFGVDIYVEIGPGRVLTGLVRRIDDRARVFSIEDMASLKKTLEAIGVSRC